MAAESEDEPVGQRDKLQPLAVPVQVQCGGFRCLAYRNEEGTWVDYHTGKPLVGDVSIVEYRFD